MRTEVHIPARALVLVLTLTLTGCKTAYLPKSREVKTDPYGAFIDLKTRSGSVVSGELIAADSTVYILISKNSSSSLKAISLADVKSYKVQYARPVDFGWIIPLYSVATLSHGHFAVITLPLNLLVTGAVAGSAYKLSDRRLPLEKLHLFARFPQGIPPNVKAEDLKWPGN